MADPSYTDEDVRLVARAIGGASAATAAHWQAFLIESRAVLDALAAAGRLRLSGEDDEEWARCTSAIQSGPDSVAQCGSSARVRHERHFQSLLGRTWLDGDPGVFVIDQRDEPGGKPLPEEG